MSFSYDYDEGIRIKNAFKLNTFDLSKKLRSELEKREFDLIIDNFRIVPRLPTTEDEENVNATN